MTLKYVEKLENVNVKIKKRKKMNMNTKLKLRLACIGRKNTSMKSLTG